MSTSAGSPAAITSPVQADELGEVGGHPVQVVGGEHDGEPVGVEVVEQVEHLVAGLDVDSGGRLVHEQELRAGGAAPGR